HHVERVAADRSGGAEDGDFSHGPPTLNDSASAATGSVEVSASMRSRMPPWPGRSALESFTPAPRFIHDSSKSPTTLSAASTSIATITGAPSAEPNTVVMGVDCPCAIHERITP